MKVANKLESYIRLGLKGMSGTNVVGTIVS
jgi:hypothetical protein